MRGRRRRAQQRQRTDRCPSAGADPISWRRGGFCPSACAALPAAGAGTALREHAGCTQASSTRAGVVWCVVGAATPCAKGARAQAPELQQLQRALAFP